MKKVAKFGGSSLADGGQIRKVAEIIKNDEEIRAIVVSAPGKRFEGDIKVTDLLIQLFTEYSNKSNQYRVTLEDILKRYEDICEDLGLGLDLIGRFREKLKTFLETIGDPFYLKNALLSCGEDFNAQLIGLYLKSLGLAAAYLSPKEAGIRLINTLDQPEISDVTYENLEKFRDSDTLFVIPGFYGITEDGERLTFLRGGSDISGAIVARGLGADIYENYTDQSYIYSSNPNITQNPRPIKNISFEEMRELSYNGFGIFQEDAIAPLLNQNIDIRIKNTNDPTSEGTVISQKRKDVDQVPLVGISAVDGMISFNVTEYLLNRKAGYTTRLLDIFVYNHISIEHIPTGIDSISVIVRKDQIKSKAQEESLINTIKSEFNLERLLVKDDLASIAIVGEGLGENRTEILFQIISTLKEEGINISYLIQGASTSSIFLLVDSKDLKRAVDKLYQRLF